MHINTLRSHSHQTQYPLYHGNLSLRASLNSRVLHIWWQLTITVIFMKLINSQPFSYQGVIQATKQHFSWHGIPHILITDNGAQFTSDLFKTFAKRYQFNHITSFPYWLQSNGWAEAAVKSARHILLTADDVELALLSIWNTAPAWHIFSPTQPLFGHTLNSDLPCHVPEYDVVDRSRDAVATSVPQL